MGQHLTIPAAFLADHAERDLPTPTILRAKGSRVVVCADDPALPDLIDDARYYAENGNDAPSWLKRSAAALLKALSA